MVVMVTKSSNALDGQLYLYVDYDMMKFYLASQNIQLHTPSPASFKSFDCRSTNSDNNLTTSPMAQAPIGVISALAAIIIGLVAVWVYRKMQRTKGPDPNETQNAMRISVGDHAPTIISEGYDHQHDRDTASSPTEHPPTSIHNAMINDM